MALRAPVAGLSIASTTSASIQDSSTKIGFCRIPTNKTSFFGSGGNLLINIVRPISNFMNFYQSGRMNMSKSPFNHFTFVLQLEP